MSSILITATADVHLQKLPIQIFCCLLTSNDIGIPINVSSVIANNNKYSLSNGPFSFQGIFKQSIHPWICCRLFHMPAETRHVNWSQAIEHKYLVMLANCWAEDRMGMGVCMCVWVFAELHTIIWIIHHSIMQLKWIILFNQWHRCILKKTKWICDYFNLP